MCFFVENQINLYVCATQAFLSQFLYGDDDDDDDGLHLRKIRCILLPEFNATMKKQAQCYLKDKGIFIILAEEFMCHGQDSFETFQRTSYTLQSLWC